MTASNSIRTEKGEIPLQGNNRNPMKKESIRGDNEYNLRVDDARKVLAMEYGTAPMRANEIVMNMQGWNKVLAFREAFSEGLVLKWRHLVQLGTYSKKSKKSWVAIGQVERNEDVLTICMGARMQDLEDLVIGLLDGVFRSFCPKEQHVLREAYRPIHHDNHMSRKDGDMKLECEDVDDYIRLFARCGVEPRYWILFCEAFLWCMRTHVPYAKDDDVEDLEKGRDGAYSKAVRNVAVNAIDGYAAMRSQLEKDVFSIGVTRFWARQWDNQTRLSFGEQFYKSLIVHNPQLMDYFAKTDMDSLAVHFWPS